MIAIGWLPNHESNILDENGILKFGCHINNDTDAWLIRFSTLIADVA